MDMPPSKHCPSQLTAFLQEASKRKLSLQPSSKKTFGRWTKEEHQRFIEGLKLFGKNWKKVEEHVGTRNGAQIRSHAQKFFNRLDKELKKKDIHGDSMSDLDDSENMEGLEEYMNDLKEKELKILQNEVRSRSQSTNISNLSLFTNTALMEENSVLNKEKKVKQEEEKIIVANNKQENNSIELKKEMLLKELSLLFSDETIKRIQTIINLLNDTCLQNEEKDENNKISFFNSLFNNLKEGANEMKEREIPKLSDFVDMNQKQENKLIEDMNPGNIEAIEKKPRKDSFKRYNNEEYFNNFGLFSLKRKGSLDESMLQKKIKRDTFN